MSTGKTTGYVVGDEYDSRRTPGVPPTLGHYGFKVPAAVEPFDQDSIARVREWLAGAPKVRTWGRYSYGLKHVAEAALGQYVANGDFIAACILSGYIVRQEPRSANAWIGISGAWVKKQIAMLKAAGVSV
jgi:hypothetical protein